ncbi:MAG: biliverdin-producing heme oxygenase, partial [Methylobacterium organophilum]|nr:biliverdin-producing heme oxygenase [Methylobacterium organophilum]
MRSRDGLHARLRAATDPAHRALEVSLDWQARVATLDGYRDLLGRLYGFHAVWEAAIGSGLADEPFLAPRRRLALLAADLDHLGLRPDAVAALPRPAAPALHGPAAATGALYVLEGSTLGGQLIGRHIAGLHGFSGAGLAYYRAHGP